MLGSVLSVGREVAPAGPSAAAVVVTEECLRRLEMGPGLSLSAAAGDHYYGKGGAKRQGAPR